MAAIRNPLSWLGISWLLVVAMFTSFLWYLFWYVLSPVDLDIANIVNWYFFMKLGLYRRVDVYTSLKLVHNWAPLLLLSCFLFSKVCLVQRCIGNAIQFLYLAVICYNMVLCAVLLLVGMKMVHIFLVALPLVLMQDVAASLSPFFSPRRLWLPLSFSILLYTCAWKCTPPSDKHPHRTCWGFWELTTTGGCKRVLATLLPSLLVASFTYWMMEQGCLPCTSTLGFAPGTPPQKPGLIGHRGCGFDAPANSLAAFQLAVMIPGLKGIETDVQRSMDGVGFLLHDPFPVQTTDVLSRCPTLNPRGNASLLYFYNGSCPLHSLNIGKKFVELNKDKLSLATQRKFTSQFLPTFRQFLDIAKNAGKSVIFDVSEPPVGHPHRKDYLNLTLKDIKVSGIPMSKVMWLPVQKRAWVLQTHPDLIMTAKSTETFFQDMLDQHIQKVNDDWSTPLSVFRRYQGANLSINMFFVNSPLMFDYAWCMGVQSVTTDNCQQLSSTFTNRLHQYMLGSCQGYQLVELLHQKLTSSESS